MASTNTQRLRGTNSSAAIKVACIAATTGNITLEAEQTIDGIALVEDDRCLVKDQTDTTENGIYRVATGSWVRDPDFNGSFDVVEGTIIPVSRGTVNADTEFRITNTGSITVGTTALTFESRGASDSSSVTFAPSGTGAVSTTVQTKLREGVSVKDFGATGDGTTDDSAAVQAAIDAHGNVFFPPGTYQMRGINIDGADQSVYAPAGAFLKDTTAADGSSMFIFGATTVVQRCNFYAHNMRVDSGGGHVFEISTNGCNNSIISADYIDHNETGKSILYNNDFNFFFNRVVGTFWGITTSHTVSAIDISTTTNKCSANTFDILRPDRSGTAPFMSLLNSAAANYNYNNSIALSNPEVCDGGVLVLGGAYNTSIHPMVLYDNATTVGHMVELKNNGGNACKRTRITGYQRNGGTLGGSKWDILITDAEDTLISHSGGPSGGTLNIFDLGSQPNVAVEYCEFHTIQNAGASSITLDYDTGIDAKAFTSTGDVTLEGNFTSSGSVLMSSTITAALMTTALSGTDPGVSGQLWVSTSTGATAGKFILVSTG